MAESGRRDPADGAGSDRPARHEPPSAKRNSGKRGHSGGASGGKAHRKRDNAGTERWRDSGRTAGRAGGSGRQDRQDRRGRDADERRFSARGGRDRTPNRQFTERRQPSERQGSRRGGFRDDRRSGGNRAHTQRPKGKQSQQPAPVDDESLAKELLTAPELPEGIEFSDLDEEVRRELRTLPKNLAETVGKHLVAAGGLVDVDPEAALKHARYAKAKAARLPIVREALGLVSYHAGHWAEALSELRAVRRMTRSDMHIAVIADAERALGRPERAVELAREAQGKPLPNDVRVELRIVAAGARRDLGQLEAAVVSLQGPDLNPAKREPWSARLFYAYADNLAAAGRREEAIKWFLHAAEADEYEETDAADRAAELSNE